LGTTNCCAAVYKDGKIQIIKNDINKTTTPSVVCFKDNNEIVFGDTAVVAGFGEPENCISGK
jgi:molecular chaperone DnaK (HSP70)